MPKILYDAIRGSSGTADSIQLHASNQSVTFPGNVTCSGTASGFGGGKVVKTDFQSYDTQVVENSGSWTATGLTKSYTPLSGSNDLVIICFQFAYCTLASGTGDVRAQFRLVHDGNTLITSQIDGGSGDSANEHSDHITFVYKVNADDTDARDIKTEFKKVAGTSAYAQLGGRVSSFVILEVEAN